MKYIALLLVCFSFPAFAAVHAASRSARFAGKHTYRASKKAGKSSYKVARFAARQLF